ncbi:hypothetical protein BFR40_07240 [Brochothrix thermosphacta]|uniref:DUF2321 domain-containing protein n=1 Tax=Brochothrix thermosphacta TaxID=2756 RepID=UPI00083FBC67|nr:DUF2321 domain-containing protein [Brochothrix thermosphacta]ODJ51787.1 hypothetical protein BFR40_07240 [Brochothrix thermosphacta]
MDRQYYQSVCLNGHQKTDRYEFATDPKEFCMDCGKKLISTCQSCRSPIEGNFHVSGILVLSNRTEKVPKYCSNCSLPYPWTSSLLNNAAELLALDASLSIDEKELITDALPDLLIDTPATQVAMAKYKIVVSKATKVVKDSLYNLLIDVVSETVKKTLFN